MKQKILFIITIVLFISLLFFVNCGKSKHAPEDIEKIGQDLLQK